MTDDSVIRERAARLKLDRLALGMSAAALARQLSVPTSRTAQILKGQRAITGDTALRLAHFFGTSAQFWLNLQAIYSVRTFRRCAFVQRASRADR